MLYKKCFKTIIFFFINIITYYKILSLSYIIFPLDYLQKENFKFLNNNINPEGIFQKIYYSNIITKLQVGSYSKNITLLIEINNDKFYISSCNPSKLSEEKAKESIFYSFKKQELFNEYLSKTYNEVECKSSVHGVYHYNEICSSRELIKFYKNNKLNEKELPIRLVRNNDGNIPGMLGLLFNDSSKYYGQEKNIITILKEENQIDNYFFFFNFNEISPLKKKINGQLYIGTLPHEVFPNKYSANDFISVNSFYSPNIFRSWKLHFDKIFIEKEFTIYFDNTIIALSYEIFNIVSTKEFHNKIKIMFMNKLINEKNCFKGNFSQNIFTEYNMIFYYCNKNVESILYENIPNIKFASIDLDYTFELTKEELFYIKDDYIYLNILFCEQDFKFWLMGQLFTTKYNFVFNTDLKLIGHYKKINNELKNNNSNKITNDNNKKLIIIIPLISFIFTCLGIIIGKKKFSFKRKIIINELLDEQNYEYKFYDKKVNERENSTKNLIIEMKGKSVN